MDKKRKPIYYTKISFKSMGAIRYQIFVNLPMRELSYEWFGCKDNVAWNYGIKLSEEDMEELLPMANALDFEIYRDKKQSDKRKDGYIGYRDEVSLCFTGITDSYIPKIEIPITYLYNEAHMLPTERLYKYLIEKYFSGKKFKREGLDYGALCLFG